MRVSLRLLFTLIFVAFILPKMLPMLGFGQVQKLQQAEEKHIQQYEQQVDNQSNALNASIDALGIRDENFKRCVQEQIRVYARIHPSSSGWIENVKQLKQLRCDGRGVSSIRGVEKMSGLESLSLMQNDITSIEPLKNHPNLRTLDISGNKEIDSVRVLTSVHNLVHVSFPNLNQDYCASAEEVDENMKFNHGSKASSNAQWIECRGKAHGYVKKLLLKKRRGEKLSREEKRKVDDYLTNKQRSR